MKRRVILFGPLFLVAAGLLAPGSAFAKDGEDDDDSGDDSGDDHEDDGGDDSGDDGGDDSSGDGSSGDGSSGGGSSGSGSGSGDSGKGKSGDSGSHDSDVAKRRVDAKDALPLDQVMRIFHEMGQDLTVLDVRLKRSNDQLLYVFKYVDASGKVAKLFFDARTGMLVQ